MKSTFKLKRLVGAVSLVTASAFLVTGCGGSSSSSAVPAATSGKTIKMAGGLGGKDGGTGGDADDFEMYNYVGGRNIVSPAGKVNASFAATNLNSMLTEAGANPLVVDADLEITVVTTADPLTKPVSGIYYLEGTGAYRLMLSDGDTAAFNAAEEITGITIEKDMTLTLPMNSGTEAYINLDYDLLIKGTLTTADVSPTQRGDLDINANTIAIFKTGVVDTSGTLDAQNGGDIDFDSGDYAFFNHGMIDTHGADSSITDAGDGGYVDLYANYRTENTGVIYAYGGASTSGGGGDGDWVDVESGWAKVDVRGKIHTYGGQGSTWGGWGDDVDIESDMGDARVSGQIWTYGGAGLDDDGGGAGSVDVESYGGGVYSTADFRLYGGDGGGATGSGGDGDDLYFYNEEGSIYEYTPHEGIFVAGNINTSGGNADADGSGDGGRGGYVYAEVYEDDYLANAQPIRFVGFSKIDARGGDGQSGGDGDGFYSYSYEGWNEPEYRYIAGDGTYVDAMIDISGGDALADGIGVNGYGGQGGTAYIETDYDVAPFQPTKGINVVRRKIDMSGGQNNNATGSWQGEAGNNWFWAYNRQAFASIDASGGDDVGTNGGIDGYGGDGGDTIYFYSELGKSKFGALDMSGGDGEYQGGDGGYLEGEAPSYSGGAINIDGGNADATLAGSTGGDNGEIWLYSPNGQASVAVGAISADVGTGETDGSDANHYIQLGDVCSGLGC